MNTASTPARQLNFLFDAYHAIQGRGGQIAWEKVSSFFTSGKFTVKLNGLVAKGATAIVVDALTYFLAKDTVLDFGAAPSVTVTLTANKAAAQTSISFSALTGPIPSGTILDFGVNKQVKTTAAAATTATSVAVEALDTGVSSGDVATYQGGRLLAKLTEDGSVGETNLTVEPVQFAIADDAEAIADHTGSTDKRTIPAGTIMVRDSSDLLFPRRDVTGSETATEILASDAVEASQYAAKSGYGTLRICQVFENLMPDADTDGNVSSTYKTELNALTNVERANVAFTDWTDSRFTD